MLSYQDRKNETETETEFSLEKNGFDHKLVFI